MTFYEWFFHMAEEPIIDNPYVDGRYGLAHISTIIISILLAIGIYFIYKYSKNKNLTRKIIIFTLSGTLIMFEVLMRIVRFRAYADTLTFRMVMWILIPRPWCAISCWLLMLSPFVNKKFFYNVASMCGLLNSVFYFISPGVGFTNQYYVFENWYSILTHALLLITAVSLMTLKFTEFKYKNIWKETISFVLMFLYSGMIVKLEFYSDPMYYMPNGDIQAGILGIDYGLYITLYVVFLLAYINTFYLISERKNIFKKKNKYEYIG